MIFFVLISHVLCDEFTQIEKTIYVNEGEIYKVNLDSIFREEKYENIYSIVQEDKGFQLDTKNLRLKQDNGAYLKQPTKILRQRQLINLGDHQGLGQFGILDQHQQGYRICYNLGDIINLNQCIELDNKSSGYDFVFIARNVIAVSKMRLSDKRLGVTIYNNTEKVDEMYFYGSTIYRNISKTIIEYCVFSNKSYLLLGIKEQDSNIEFLEILSNYKLVNTKFAIDNSMLSIKSSQLYDIKAGLEKAYLVYNAQNQVKLINSFIFNQQWISQPSQLFLKDFRALELGYNQIQEQYSQSVFICSKDQYNLNSQSDIQLYPLYKAIKPNAQVKYTRNYLVVLQNNLLIVTKLHKSSQRTNKIEGQLLKIDVDFQNDILIVFTQTKILTYYLKLATLKFSPKVKTDYLDTVNIQATSVQDNNKQVVKITFQVLQTEDYKLYLKNDLTSDIYYNAEYPGIKKPNQDYYFQNEGVNASAQNVPLQGISGADINVDLIVNSAVQIIPTNLFTFGIKNVEKSDKIIIQEQFQVTNSLDQYAKLFRQFDDFSFSVFQCQRVYTQVRINLIQINYITNYECLNSETYFISKLELNQGATFQFDQSGEENSNFAVLFSHGELIRIYNGDDFNDLEVQNNRFVEMKVGIKQLFTYTIKNTICIYNFSSGEFIYQIDLSFFGEPKKENVTRKLWVNQLKTNLLVIYYGDELIIGRFTTSQFYFLQRIHTQYVIDLSIISEDKFIVLTKDMNTLKLIQYRLDNGQFIMQRELDAHGYRMTEAPIINDYVQGVILVQAKLNNSKALLVFGDTELERDSLIKVIKLQDNEIAVSIINVNHQQGLFIRSTDKKRNSQIVDMFYGVQPIEVKSQTPQQFNQQLDLKYSYRSQFIQQNFDIMRKFYLENLYYDIIVNKPLNKIHYQNETQLKIEIKPNSFQGQIKTILLNPVPQYPQHQVALTTRFKNIQMLSRVSYLASCKLLALFKKILCVGTNLITYQNLNGTVIQEIKLKVVQKIKAPIWILNSNQQHAVVQIDEQLILIRISDIMIEVSNQTIKLDSPFNSSLFYKEWLVLYQQSYLRYYKFNPDSKDQWLTEKYIGYQILGINSIQYDPISQQMFYSVGDDNLYYFKSSLEGDVIAQFETYSYNIPLLLKYQNIYQTNTKVQYIQIITQEQQSFILISSSNSESNSKIFNVTIKPKTQQFQFNNIYIVNGLVQDIQLIDDYTLVQTFFQFPIQYLYKRTNDSKSLIPLLSLEGLFAWEIVGLYKNGSQIVNIYRDYYGSRELSQCNIDEDMFITIKDFEKFEFKNISLLAQNYMHEAQIIFKLIKYEAHEDHSLIGWVLLASLVILFCYFKKKK